MRFTFVHGTGVRRERFDDLFRWVRDGLFVSVLEEVDINEDLAVGVARRPKVRPVRSVNGAWPRAAPALRQGAVLEAVQLTWDAGVAQVHGGGEDLQGEGALQGQAPVVRTHDGAVQYFGENAGEDALAPR
ncbi:hypothetical protein ABT173_29485 [Streptomyces sp. NPDC001795]|uniref:hypothetical protein n=1 Tax=unclassified Streptomyces TaxID=2593676 RepID=UPI00331ABF37